MKPPVETVRISKQGREILLKIKRRTGLERWNDISRSALCRSLNNRSFPPTDTIQTDTAIEIEWKTFSGDISDVLAAVFWVRAHKDKINLEENNEVSKYFRAHIERGLSSLQNVKDLKKYMECISQAEI